MRILLDYRPALRRRTGVGEYAHQMAAALVRQARGSDRVVLFSSSWKDRLPADAVAGADVVDARIPVAALNLAWHRLGWPAAETFAGPVDVAWSMHPLLMPARHAAQVITIHDLFFLHHPDATVREIRRDYAALAARHAVRADAVITVSEHTRAQAVSRLGVAPERIAICPPGAPSMAPRAEPRTTGPILYLGTVEPRKNVVALIEAYRRLREARADIPSLVFAGKVDGGPPATADGVRFLGYVGDEVRRQLLNEASMLVLPSLEEGFGIPALEAMTVGVPVIAAARGALPEVVGDAGVLVDADDPAGFIRSLSTAIARLLDDASRRRDLAVRGMARARSFSWDESAARARDALAAAMERRKARR